MVNLVPQIPQEVRHRMPTLQHVCGTGGVGGELVHVSPPCLRAQERSTYVRTEGTAWDEHVWQGIVRVGLEGKVCGTLYAVLVGRFLYGAEFLVPCQLHGGEGLHPYAWFAIQTCGGHGGFYWFEIE